MLSTKWFWSDELRHIRSGAWALSPHTSPGSSPVLNAPAPGSPHAEFRLYLVRGTGAFSPIVDSCMREPKTVMAGQHNKLTLESHSDTSSHELCMNTLELIYASLNILLNGSSTPHCSWKYFFLFTSGHIDSILTTPTLMVRRSLALRLQSPYSWSFDSASSYVAKPSFRVFGNHLFCTKQLCPLKRLSFGVDRLRTRWTTCTKSKL